MTEKLNKVFFLGAGFSKAIDSRYPLLMELSEYVAEQIRCGKGSLACHYDDELSTQIKENIESLLTYLSADWPWKNTKQAYTNKALYVEITEILGKYFVELSKTDFTKSQFIDLHSLQALRTFLANSGKDNVDFITVNYDMILERFFYDCYKSGYTPRLDEFYKYPIANILQRDSGLGIIKSPSPYDRVPTILKLHGSANWFWEGKQASDQVYYTEWNENNYGVDPLSGLIPYIVPPVMDKTAFYNHNMLRYFWKEAHRLLSNADEIYIIGFSFPPTDLSVKFLFQSALRKSSANIYIVNPADIKKLRMNYDLVFGKYNENIHYDYCGTQDAFQKFVNEKLTNGGQPWN